MNRIPKPTVGNIVTITTRYPDYRLVTESEWREYTYSDVEVLPPERWFGPDSIKVTGNETMPFRVINMNNVSSLKEGDRNVSPSEVKGKTGVISVPGSSGSVYVVTLKDGEAISCTCPHNTYRKAFCKHMKQAVSVTC